MLRKTKTPSRCLMLAATCTAAFLLASCAGSKPFVEAPQLATIPAELLKECESPSTGFSKAKNPVTAQAEAWSRDRKALAQCKARHSGLVTVVTTERSLLAPAKK